MSSTEETLAVAVPVPTSWRPQDDPRSLGALPLSTENALSLSKPEANRKSRTTPMVEKRYRSLLKAVSWRATGTLDTIIISFLVTGKIKMAVSIGFVELFTKIGLFYAHERIWTKIPLGRAQPPEDYTI